MGRGGCGKWVAGPRQIANSTCGMIIDAMWEIYLGIGAWGGSSSLAPILRTESISARILQYIVRSTYAIDVAPVLRAPWSSGSEARQLSIDLPSAPSIPLFPLRHLA